MTWSGSTSALAIAEVHFPDQASKVRHLFRVSETFRSMCEDLAAAVETLKRLDEVPRSERELRRQEYKDLERALVSEIGETLSQSNVVVFRQSDKSTPRPR
jgi:sialic acid synthase SpsE